MFSPQDDDHPVKVGLSDAYIIDRTIYCEWQFVIISRPKNIHHILSVARRKTIYEYHRLNMKDKHIRNETAIVFSALETCNMHKVQIFNTSPWVSMFDKSGINLFPTRTAPPALQPPRTMPTRPTLSVVGAQSWGGAQMGRTEIGKIGSSANVTSTMSPSLKCAIHQDRLFNFCLLSCYQNCQWRIQMHTSIGSLQNCISEKVGHLAQPADPSSPSP